MALEQAIDNDNAAIDSFHSEESTTSRIIATVNHTVANITHNSYKFGGNYFNAIKGIYKLDCSSYVGQVLKIADPSAYASITDWARVYKPVSRDYYAFSRISH
ncbi:MAG: hypothetical protein HWD59_11595 [Coxiellaceae bacterium]|nr:MAG: hypothetical protein HWD59_11595 [Coxiellaceae bacterium]